jgi:hypothetical protein
MSEGISEDLVQEGDGSLGYEVGAGGLSLLSGLFAPIAFNALTLSGDLGVFLTVFGIFAASILYWEHGTSIPSGVSFGFGMLVSSFAGRNWLLLALAVSGMTTNLATNGLALEPAESPLRESSGQSCQDSV